MAADEKTAKAEASAQKAYAKSLRPWYKKKRLLIPGVLAGIFLLGAVISAISGDSEETASSENGSPKTSLFPGRTDAQHEDQERNIGGSTKFAGYTTTVTAAGFQQSVSPFEQAGYLKVSVTVENRDKETQPYNYFDWVLQTPSGQVLDPTITSSDEDLNSGSLISGGTVSGAILFEIAEQKGDFYIIYKPDPFNAARGIWKVTV